MLEPRHIILPFVLALVCVPAPAMSEDQGSERAGSVPSPAVEVSPPPFAGLVGQAIAPFPALVAELRQLRAAAQGIPGAEALPPVHVSRQRAKVKSMPPLAAHGIRGVENGPVD